MVSRVEGLLHFENINYQGGVDYMHWYHIVERDVHLGLALEKHFIHLQNWCGVDLVHLDTLNYHIKRQVDQRFHTSKNLHIMDFSHECVEKKKKEIIKKTFLNVKT